ncbi:MULTISPECIES: sensor histidine kinase [Streptomycetaceae]|uniref:histidine kinase n=1 Tax=Streptantibioticus cattleyicolor (strain ATCC 35852 / DSM 46488 / JCM 4925 / NBRC 14057 / NRRL 8057) TaxID=1003195 RepID=F8JQN4_STREN|nr:MULTISPECIES: HAMP domain-containing sensor histidine kinase [Streptomycetaceae]AEW96915.1 two-component system sensor kinase [Streptantibioticus cattleyicolor NRRL 8057 = DSM 46488]MYS61392.1 HAMP domain-containing protein [Streptomyces sp. SID5468]CCB77244.1 Sensor protein [Streptantibioticus cattleyicolor NRRL 8057 = DSM 46488]
MRARLLPLLLVLMGAVLLALGLPLAASLAAAQQQRLVVDRIDDTARFAAIAQYVPVHTTPDGTIVSDEGERKTTLRGELARYESLYGIKAGVFMRNGQAMAAAPAGWRTPRQLLADQAFQEALAGRRSHNPPQVWPWQHSRITVASPLVRDGDVVAVVYTDSPTDAMRSRVLRGWVVIAGGEMGATAVAVLAAFRLTGWVLRPVKVLDRATHDIATGRLASRVAAAGGPPELRRLAHSFNEMADNVEQVLEQQRAFVADASHQLRNPLAALLLRIDLLALELPDGHAEVASVREEGKRLATVLDDLLGLALAEHATADLRLTDIAALATERVAAWRPAAERDGVALRYQGPAAVTGWADPVAVSSALDAVVDNAVKFTARGAPAGACPAPGEAAVTVTVAAAGDTVTVTVTDAGPGLTDDELARVGDRFWRSSRHQNVDGSGLGLSIARVLLRQGGGSLTFARNEPCGLRVTVSVPRTAPEEAPAIRA